MHPCHSFIIKWTAVLAVSLDTQEQTNEAMSSPPWREKPLHLPRRPPAAKHKTEGTRVRGHTSAAQHGLQGPLCHGFFLVSGKQINPSTLILLFWFQNVHFPGRHWAEGVFNTSAPSCIQLQIPTGKGSRGVIPGAPSPPIQVLHAPGQGGISLLNPGRWPLSLKVKAAAKNMSCLILKPMLAHEFVTHSACLFRPFGLQRVPEKENRKRFLSCFKITCNCGDYLCFYINPPHWLRLWDFNLASATHKLCHPGSSFTSRNP